MMSIYFFNTIMQGATPINQDCLKRRWGTFRGRVEVEETFCSWVLKD